MKTLTWETAKNVGAREALNKLKTEMEHTFGIIIDPIDTLPVQQYIKISDVIKQIEKLKEKYTL